MAEGPHPQVVAIGGSAGAIEPLRTLVHELPAGLPAAVIVVIHGVSGEKPVLPAILERAGELDAGVPHDGEELVGGRIYVATVGRHLIVDDGRLRLLLAAEENRARPAIDPLFRSAARSHGPRALGVILSGTLDDGSAGLYAIRRRGGRTLVQDPREAVFAEMPANAIDYAQPDKVLPVVDLAHEVIRLVMEEEANPSHVGPSVNGMESHADEEVSGLTCPQCHGALWQRDVGGLLQYRCRTGHVLGHDSLAAEQDRMVEEALWAGVRALEERAELCRNIAERFRARGDAHGASRHLRRADLANRRAETLRDAMFGDDRLD